MSKSLIIEGLKDAVRHARGTTSFGTARIVHIDDPLDVKAIRVRLGLTQRQFANQFGFPVGTLQNWEQGRRQPAGVNKNFLKVIDRLPEEVQKVLSA